MCPYLAVLSLSNLFLNAFNDGATVTCSICWWLLRRVQSDVTEPNRNKLIGLLTITRSKLPRSAKNWRKARFSEVRAARPGSKVKKVILALRENVLRVIVRGRWICRTGFWRTWTTWLQFSPVQLRRSVRAFMLKICCIRYGFCAQLAVQIG